MASRPATRAPGHGRCREDRKPHAPASPGRDDLLQLLFVQAPPFGFALFYLRGVAPKSVRTGQIYRGALPFIAIQLIGLVLIIVFPQLVTGLLD